MTLIHSDGAFKSMMDEVSDEMDIKINPVAKTDHVPEAERNNRTIKERGRTGFYRLP